MGKKHHFFITMPVRERGTQDYPEEKLRYSCNSLSQLLRALQGKSPSESQIEAKHYQSPASPWTSSQVSCLQGEGRRRHFTLSKAIPSQLSWQKICLQCRRPGFDSWARKIPWRREWQPIPVFLPGESHGQRSLVGCGPQGRKESDTTERLHFHFLSYWTVPLFIIY